MFFFQFQFNETQTKGDYMAYIAFSEGSDGEWHGPIPNKKGEWCGNRHPSKCCGAAAWPTGLSDHEDDRSPESESDQENRFYHGRPGRCPAGTSEELSKQGYIGLYLNEDRPIVSHSKFLEIDTDALLEDVVSGQRPAERPFDPQLLVRE